MKLTTIFKNDPVLRRLGKIAVVGAGVTIAAGLFFESRIRKGIGETPYFKETLRLLHEKPNVVSFLGPPIGIGKVDLGNPKNFSTGTEAQLEVPITGSNHKGLVHMWSHRTPGDADWAVDRIEVSLKSMPSKRILVHKSEPADAQKTEAVVADAA